MQFAGQGGLFVALNITIRQYVCAPVFLSSTNCPTQDCPFETVLREVVIEMPEGCDAAAIDSVELHVQARRVQSLGCFGTYTTDDDKRIGVCSVNALCIESTSGPEQLASVYCTCREPAYANPDLPPHYAPYEASGCLVPTRMEALTVTREQVIVSLQKPQHSSERVNLTLDLTGDPDRDTAEMTWTVSNAAELLHSASWLRVPTVSSRVPAIYTGQAAESVQIELEVDALGLRELAEAYTAILSFSIESYAARRVPQTLVQKREVPAAACRAPESPPSIMLTAIVYDNTSQLEHRMCNCCLSAVSPFHMCFI